MKFAIRSRGLAILCAFSLMFIITAPVHAISLTRETETAKPVFADVTSDCWFYDDVQYVAQHELMFESVDTNFCPNDYITRSQAVLILHRMCGEPEVISEPTWDDVPTDSLFSEAIDWAYTYGIAEATSANMFSPDMYLSREAFIKMLYCYADYKYYDLTGETDLSQFRDGHTINSSAMEAFRWALDNQIIQPNASIDRFAQK